MKGKTVRSEKVSLSDLIGELERYRERYGDCPVVGIVETLGECNGMVNPYAVYVRKNPDECERIYVRSRSGFGTTVPDREQSKRRISRKQPAQIALFGIQEAMI